MAPASSGKATAVATEANGAGGYLSWKRRASSSEFEQEPEKGGKAEYLSPF